MEVWNRPKIEEQFMQKVFGKSEPGFGGRGVWKDVMRILNSAGTGVSMKSYWYRACCWAFFFFFFLVCCFCRFLVFAVTILLVAFCVIVLVSFAVFVFQFLLKWCNRFVLVMKYSFIKKKKKSCLAKHKSLFPFCMHKHIDTNSWFKDWEVMLII